jgi:hypothetical protein
MRLAIGSLIVVLALAGWLRAGHHRAFPSGGGAACPRVSVSRRSTVSRRLTAWVVIVVMTPFFAASSRAEEKTPLVKDLTAVIALHGQSCGQVVSAVRQSESDYLALCEDGKRYHVFTNATGRVVVEKQ